MDYLQYNTSCNKISLHLWNRVLNLIINGLPSILNITEYIRRPHQGVLNLIINGLPSILLTNGLFILSLPSFKPYYKWITFNTVVVGVGGYYLYKF